MDIKGDLKKAAGAVVREFTKTSTFKDPKTGKEMPVQEAGVGGAKKAVAKAIESFSHRGSELTKAERTVIKNQNKVADTMKSKDLDAMDRGKKAAATRKENIELDKDMAHDAGYRKGTVQGAAAGAATTAAAALALAASKKKGSQPDHHVTTSDNFTKKSK